MNRTAAERVASAVLYEGYILYPYRPSVKNRQRWTFGGLYPEAYCLRESGEASSCQTECLLHGSPATTLGTTIRFLHLTSRQVFKVDALVASPGSMFHAQHSPQLVEILQVGDRSFQSWQEAEERRVEIAATTLSELSGRPCNQRFSFPASRRSEPIRTTSGQLAGEIIREQQTVDGLVELSAMAIASDLYRVRVRVVNQTALAGGGCASRDEALLRSLVSTHAILTTCDGEFVSLLDPPEQFREHIAGCDNIGAFPVLVGDEGDYDTMLSSPIILYDYPQIAPESPGDFFDGTEIDEMLTLRILTLTDEEKRQMTALDERASALLARTEAFAREQLLSLHGTVRDLRPTSEDHDHG